MSSEKIQKLLISLTDRTDILLAIMLVGIIFMMVLPMPTLLVDIMIAVNLCGAVVLMMVAIYIKTPVAFSSFPTVLLLSTLFRLALSISTTRLILLQADAGAIIYTFGDFVVGGNMVVGLVVFLIITLVQFIVITKGSERVAEVSARFSLDAMPGKQMSIDSDLRSGVISMAQARKLRSHLQKESQMYGAMDGAMKFVKGDAIAGLLIIVVNILGGVSIGVFQQGMTAGEAMQLYSLLTVGDGLVAQIPALFISITSGIIVTRVASDDAENLGADIGRQIIEQPRAMMAGSAMMFGFAMIPGFPALVFILLGLLSGAMGFALYTRDKQANGQYLDIYPTLAPSGHAGNNIQLPDTDNELAPNIPLVLELPDDAKAHLPPALLNQEFAKVRYALLEDLGVPFPGVHLRFTLTESRSHFVTRLHGITAGKGEVRPGSVLVSPDTHTLDRLGISYEHAVGFVPEVTALWVNSEHTAVLEEQGLMPRTPAEILSHQLNYVLRDNADAFIGIQETHQILSEMEPRFGELVKEAQRAVPVNKIAEVLRRLVAEGIPVRDMRSILEALVEWGKEFEDPELLSEKVRTFLKRQISHSFGGEENIIPVYLIDPQTEETLRSSIRQTPSGTFLSLDTEQSEQIISSIRQQRQSSDVRKNKPAIITALDIRRHLKKLIERELKDVAVLSYEELTPEVSVQPVGKIQLNYAGA